MIIELSDSEARCLIPAALLGLKGSKQIICEDAVKTSLTKNLLNAAKKLVSEAI